MIRGCGRRRLLAGERALHALVLVNLAVHAIFLLLRRYGEALALAWLEHRLIDEALYLDLVDVVALVDEGDCHCLTSRRGHVFRLEDVVVSDDADGIRGR